MTDQLPTLETRLNAAQTPYDKLAAMTELAWELRYRDPQRSKTLTNEALAQTETAELEALERQQAIANIHRNLAHHHYIDVEYSEAITHGEHALTIYQSNGQLIHQLDPLATLSNVHRQLGDYSEALQYSLRQLQTSETVDDQASRVDALNRIGVIYSLMGKYEDALEQYALCLPFYEANNDPNGQARIYNNCVIEYMNLQEYEKALAAGLKSLALFEAADNLFGQSRIHGNLVRLYAQLEDYESAMVHGEQALALADQLDNKEHKMVNSLYIGQLQLRFGNNDQAISMLQIALAIAVDTKSLTYQFECHEALAAAHKNVADFETALRHYEQFHTLKESVFNEESDTKLRNLEVSYRTRVAQQAAVNYQRRNEELELLREQDRMYFERLSEMKDELLRTASHDLKSPLSTLSMLAFMLKTNPTFDGDAQEVIRQMDYQIERMRAFVIGVLDLAKLETGRALSLEPLPMVKFIKSIVLDFEPQAADKQISLQFSSSDEDILAEFDPVEMRRVIENLLTNAIKYSLVNGKVAVSIQKQDKVLISVSDTGVGIPTDAVPRVFERFFRVDDETHRAVDGSGLGLAIAKAIIEQHDGEIWAESVVGEGSTFTISLPLASDQPSTTDGSVSNDTG